jgi:hypothetical protein
LGTQNWGAGLSNAAKTGVFGDKFDPNFAELACQYSSTAQDELVGEW